MEAQGLLDVADFHSLACLCRDYCRFQHLHAAHTVIQIGRYLRAFFKSGQEVSYCVNEFMLIADDMARRPPGSNVWVGGIRNKYRPEALLIRRVGQVQELELVHALKI